MLMTAKKTQTLNKIKKQNQVYDVISILKTVNEYIFQILTQMQFILVKTV